MGIGIWQCVHSIAEDVMHASELQTLPDSIFLLLICFNTKKMWWAFWMTRWSQCMHWDELVWLSPKNILSLISVGPQ